MERAISEMEKIRKAEEIYSRRKNGVRSNATGIEKNKNVYRNLFQILVLFNIAIVIVAVQNRNYIFKDEFVEKVNGYNVNIKETVEGWLTTDNKEEENKKQEENKTNENSDVNTDNSRRCY